MRISDWSSDVCSSDLQFVGDGLAWTIVQRRVKIDMRGNGRRNRLGCGWHRKPAQNKNDRYCMARNSKHSLCTYMRSEEHTSELQSLMRISYAVFCLKKKKINTT